MKFLLLALVFFFIGCSDSIDVSYNDDAYEQYLQEKLKKREIYGRLVFPVSFVPKSVNAFELDSNLKKTHELDVSFDAKKKTFEIEKRDYESRYLQITTSGLWKNFDSSGHEVTFESITDIAAVSDSLYLRLFSHLEIPRIKQLVKEGYPFVTAKNKAVYDLFSLYRDTSLSSLESSFGVGLSEQLELKKSTTEYFPYVLFFYGGTDSAFVKNIEKFRKSFTNGVWQDSVARVKSADYLLKNYYMLYELLDDWALKEKLVRQEYDYCYVLNYMSNVLSKSYDSLHCSFSGQTFQILAPTSEFYKDSVVCVEMELCMLVRPFTDLEKKLGSCVYEKNAKDVTKEYDGNTYICRHPYEILIPDSTNVENWKLKRDD
ncbi:hypothetical protein IKQ19_14620 [Candidatus Saccharibacteria bacterium]|nr:hypothetical protein [Candidatus Saccharibacteria bacterium]